VALDRVQGRGRQRQVQPAQPSLEDDPEFGREWGKLVDARRERLSWAGQAPLLCWCPGVRPGSAPGVVVVRIARLSGLPSLGWFTAGFPRSPSRATLPFNLASVRMPDGTGVAGAMSTHLSTNPRLPGKLVDNSIADAEGHFLRPASCLARVIRRWSGDGRVRRPPRTRSNEDAHPS
jgi:hypothetical protein